MMKKLEEHLQKRSSKCFYINRQTHRKERFVVEEHQKMPDAMTDKLKSESNLSKR